MIDRITAAKSIVREAGAILLDGYLLPKHVSHKGDIDLVTEYDTRSENHILHRLTTLFPSDEIIAEESGHLTLDRNSKFTWYVDPLDGTTNYAHSFPFFAVSIAIAHQGQIVAGVVLDPLRDELFAAEKGRGATLNENLISVSETLTLDHSLLATGFPYDVRTTKNNNLDQFSRVILRAQGIRRAGAAALDLCYTANSRLDAYWEQGLKQWDVAAGALIVQEAGGKITDISGGANWLTTSSVIATNGLIHNELIEALDNDNLVLRSSDHHKTIEQEIR